VLSSMGKTEDVIFFGVDLQYFLTLLA